MPLYENIYGRKVVYWLSMVGVSVPPPSPLFSPKMKQQKYNATSLTHLSP